MSLKAIVLVNENNRVTGVRYGPYTSSDASKSNEHLIDIEFFPDKDPMGALFNSTKKSFTYDDAWTTEQARLYPSEE